MVLLGLQLVATFFRSLGPGTGAVLPFPIGPQGLYFVAFSGCCLVAWGGCLFAAARGAGRADPSLARSVGTATAVGLVLNALYRMAVWTLGDFAWAGSLPRIEAAIFLVLALAFLWLRPPSVARVGAR